ncbi:nuclear transport factor 2 family protein [Marinobacterium jannaschii]|uniref:nuclear transport factor 2 family protein n=1 Tax=Marinobacterium jannaschii TaxID=64970 RepID=UPI0004896965|nr:nuclear transport factor 2 family protein [Marinobacterium jannaschii]
MKNDLVQQAVAAEQRLKAAMVDSDIAVLDELLANDLVFINHLGHRASKQDDIALHQSGLLSIDSIEFTELQVRPEGNFAFVYVNAEIKGLYNGAEANGSFAFSRVWSKSGSQLQLVSAQSTIIT